MLTVCWFGIAVSAIPFPEQALTGHIDSQAIYAFTSLRGYPQRRGEVATAQTSVRHVLSQAYLATHDILGRLVSPHPSSARPTSTSTV